MTEQLQALLASIKKPRKVRTAAGAKRYGQPIGSIIMPGGKTLKVGDKGYDEADKLLSANPRATLPPKAKARIESAPSIDLKLPLNGVIVLTMSTENLQKNVVAARAELLSNSKADTYETTADNLAKLRSELAARGLDPGLPEPPRPKKQNLDRDNSALAKKIAAKSVKIQEENNKYDEFTPLTDGQIEDWSDNELVKNFVAVRHTVDHNTDLPPKKFYAAFDNFLAMKEALSNRNIDIKNIEEHPSIKAQQEAQASSDAADIKEVRKFRDDTPEQRAAEAQRERTKRELDAKKYLSSSLPMSASERRIRTYSKSIPLNDFAAMRKPLAQDGEPTFSDRTEPRELPYKRVNWEMLPQIADYADSWYSEKYADDIKHYLSSVGAEQVRAHLSGRINNDRAKKTVESLDHITDMDLPDNLMLFRGMAVAPDSEIGQLSQGDTFTDPSFISTSLKRSEAKFFASIKQVGENTQKVIFEIETRPGLKGAPLYALGYDGLETDALWNNAMGDEYEVLLKREAEFVVKDVTYVNETRMIRLVPIGQKDTTIESE